MLVDKDKPLRDYNNASNIVKNFYYTNHKLQTYQYNIDKREEIYPLKRYKLNFKQMNEIIQNTFDDSDPDFENGSQVYHNL